MEEEFLQQVLDTKSITYSSPYEGYASVCYLDEEMPLFILETGMDVEATKKMVDEEYKRIKENKIARLKEEIELESKKLKEYKPLSVDNKD